jgi:hypothetical protein
VEDNMTYNDSPLEFKMKLSYKKEKEIKKMMGKNTAREIAFGRNMVKLLRKKYVTS